MFCTVPSCEPSGLFLLFRLVSQNPVLIKILSKSGSYQNPVFIILIKIWFLSKSGSYPNLIKIRFLSFLKSRTPSTFDDQWVESFMFRWGPSGQLDTICNVKTQVVMMVVVVVILIVVLVVVVVMLVVVVVMVTMKVRMPSINVNEKRKRNSCY